MEALQADLVKWLHDFANWLQATLGFGVKDLALFLGGGLMVIAVLWLGIYSGKPRYREAARFGWLLLIVAILFVGWGVYDHNLPSN
jgi:hypothetical protein